MGARCEVEIGRGAGTTTVPPHRPRAVWSTYGEFHEVFDGKSQNTTARPEPHTHKKTKPRIGAIREQHETRKREFRGPNDRV